MLTFTTTTTTTTLLRGNQYLAIIYIAVLVAGMANVVNAGPLAYGICQTGCNAVAVACYAAAGYTFGTVTGGAGIPLVIVQCNAALGVCMTACVAAGFAPTP